MKRWLLLLSLGVIGTFAVLRINARRQVPELSDQGKNFGAFPPEIPSAQFDDLFI